MLSPASDHSEMATSEHPAQHNQPAPVELLRALEDVHSHLSAWQVETATRHEQLEAEAAQARAQHQSVRSELEKTQNEINQLRDDNVRLENQYRAQRGDLLAQIEQRDDELAKHRAAIEKHREALNEHKAQLNVLAEQLQRREEEIKQRDDEIQERNAEIAKRDRELQQRNEEVRDRNDKLRYQIERNHELHDQLLKLYEDLTAADLPTLILRVCVNLTHSEHGLFVEADGDGTLSEIGLKEMPEAISSSLYNFTRRVAQNNEPLIENNSSKLPDGSNLVNLAAMPVTLHSALKGVILVANKRDANYTDEDTELLLAIGRHAGLAMENRRLHCELGAAFESTISVLADAIEAKDAYTRGHCESVARLAVDVARRLGLPEKTVDQVRYAALLHDIGKIGVPDGVLLKPGKLSPEEFLMIQRHSMIGRDLISRVPSLSKIAPIVLHHHERIDGSGYPDGLSGENIDLTARIICVVDAFDAMTTPRPYREPVSPAEALAELKRCQNTHFDEGVVEAISAILQERSTPVRA